MNTSHAKARLDELETLYNLPSLEVQTRTYKAWKNVKRDSGDGEQNILEAVLDLSFYLWVDPFSDPWGSSREPQGEILVTDSFRGF